MSLVRVCCGCALLTAWVAADIQAQSEQPVNRPLAARRVVQQFDFEPDAREVFDLPRFWDLAQDGSRMAGHRPGFPAWNSAGFDDSRAYSGTRSLRLVTRGGSVGLRLEPGVIPVFPGTDYLVSARVTTEGLKHARAGLAVQYLDKSNKPLPGSLIRSDMVTTTGNGDWHLVTAMLPGSFSDAAYIQIDLEILQPMQAGEPEHDKHQVWPQDFDGSAWFDQVAVVQLPRAALSTSSPNNIVRGQQKPRISVMLRDLTGEQITGTLTLQDAAGQTVDQVARPLTGGSGSWEWDPNVSGYGWYRATLELRTGERRVGATYVDLAWLPPISTQGGAGDESKFALILDDLPRRGWSSLPDLLDAACPGGAVTIPVWTPDATPASITTLSHDLVALMDRLRASGRRVTFSLPRLPIALAADLRLDVARPLEVFAREERQWGPYLVPLLDKYGQGVQRWQIGALGAAPGHVDTVSAGAARAAAVLSRLVPGPIVELPWPADQARPMFSGADVELLAAVSPGVSGSGLDELLQLWAPSDRASPPTLVLGALPEPFSRLDSCASLVKQAVLLWAARQNAEPPTLAMTEPWSWTGPNDGPPMPRAELVAWANLSERLRGRRSAGLLEPRPGVACVILAPTAGARSVRTGSLVLWGDQPGESGRFVDLYLGETPVEVVDLFGNRATIGATPVNDAEPGGPRAARPPVAHRIPVSDTPVFIENVDVDLARFAASFRLDPPFASNSTSEHDLSMLLSNPWPTRIEGRLIVLEPGGLSGGVSSRDRSWRITPRTSAFSIGPGESARIPVSVSFSPVEEAGPKNFLVEIELAGTRDYAPIRLSTTLDIGASDFHMELSYRVVNGTDIAVEAQVINRGKSPSSFELSGFADGYPRGKAYISDLPPGALATRRFMFPGGVSALKGKRVAVGAQDASTPSRVTRSVLIE